MPLDIPLGTRAEISHAVEQKHTLEAVNPELPPVLATPWMIGWMEAACYLAQKPFCEPGEVTVGTRIDVVHRAPCTVGARVTASAELARIEDRFYIFKVQAQLDSGLKIGWGEVHRAVVHVPRFMAKT